MVLQLGVSKIFCKYKKITYALAILAATLCITLIYKKTIDTSRTEKAMEYYQTVLDNKNLSFKKEPVRQLEELSPENDWTCFRKLNFNNISGGKKIRIEIYYHISNQERFEKSRNENILIEDYVDGVYAYLIDGNESYGIDYLGGIDVENIEITARDVNNDGKREILISSCKRFKEFYTVVGYNSSERKWEIWLFTGYLDFVDYEGNGIKTITTLGLGSISPVVLIHIWDKNHFETINIGQITGYNRMRLTRSRDRIYFVPYMPDGKGKKVFEFKNGKLWEVANPVLN